MRISPRAATGTLDELLPVAAFTTPPGAIAGVSWAGNDEAAQTKTSSHLNVVGQRWQRRRLNNARSPEPIRLQACIRQSSLMELMLWFGSLIYFFREHRILAGIEFHRDGHRRRGPPLPTCARKAH